MTVVLASPRLGPVLRAAKKAGHAFVVIDGTLIAIDRVAKDRPFYSGKHKKHGMNRQVISSPDGTIWWVSGPLPGSVTVWGHTGSIPGAAGQELPVPQRVLRIGLHPRRQLGDLRLQGRYQRAQLRDLRVSFSQQLPQLAVSSTQRCQLTGHMGHIGHMSHPTKADPG